MKKILFNSVIARKVRPKQSSTSKKKIASLLLAITNIVLNCFLVLCIISCGKPLPSFDGIDITQWKDDKNGCTHYREKTLEQLTAQREKIKGLSETEILKLFGKPDQTELYKRNQKFFYYFVEPSTKCDSTKTNARKLSIRFNAMEMAKDVVIDLVK